MPSFKSIVCSSLLPALCLAAAKQSYVSTLGTNAGGMLTESMNWMDGFYDSSAGYLYDLSAQAALRHETRSSAWYAVGLLARNEGNDVGEALKIITNVIGGQYKIESEQWYGDYQQEPEEPYVGSAYYPQHIYGTWDPNWRGFIGTTLVIAVEEFGHLIPKATTNLILESLYNATKGDTYRVGGVDNDNLYPAYSNPSLMRAFVSGWTGRKLNDKNMTVSGEKYAKAIIDLFDRADTLSEFNSGTYTGVSLFALTLWCKYLPSSSIMKQHGPKMVQATWESVAQLWHPTLKNVAGPWDRSYGFDMNRYLSLLALQLWNLIGKEASSLISRPQIMSHSADFAYAPLMAVLGPYHKTLVPASVISALKTFRGEHTFESSTFSPPFDLYPRNITAWLAPKISIGAESFNETVLGGPATSTNSFRPALIQWATGTGSEVGFIAWHATEKSLLAMASKNTLNLTYPLGTANSVFTILLSPFKAKKTLSSWNDVQGLDVRISGNVNETFALSYAGKYGGNSSTINDFEFWNFTYSMPVGSTAVPNLLIEVQVK